MKMTIYWTMQHSRRAVHEFRFPCRLLLAQSGSGVPGMASAAGNPDALRAIRSCADIGRQRAQYAVHSL